MNIGGLNNLFLAPTPQKGGGKAASPAPQAEAGGFGDILGQVAEGGEETVTMTSTAEGEALDPGGLPSSGFPVPAPAVPVGERVVPAVNPLGQLTAKINVSGKKQEEAVDSLTRRVVWNDFLRKMKEDFGITAEDVLGAFASLSDDDLAKPPEETVDKVVLALGLGDQQAALAKQYFGDLIRKTQSRSLGEELESSGKQIQLTLMSERELKRKATQRSIEKMNSNFFLQGQYARPSAPAQAPTPDASAVSQEARTQGQPVPLAGPVATPMSTPGAGPVSAPPRQPATSAINGQLPEELAARMQPVDDSKDRSVDQLIQKFMNTKRSSPEAQAPSAAIPAGALVSAPAARAAEAAPTFSAAALNQLLGKLNAGSDSGEGDESGDSTDASFLNAPLSAGAGALGGPAQTAGDFKTQLAQVNPNQPVSVPDLVQQAQVMVRDGGGEMKVTLNPEGLGEVAMRVSVEDGRVNVQMITESDEAKKMIDRQLGELKASLTSNHLQVADIKVDTASSLGRQMEQQYQDAQRQMAQQSWEQFRQDNQGWRRSFFETPSARLYKGQAEAPRDVSAPASGPRRAANRRLDLVA